MPICKRFFISGKVQGVWYRASTAKEALKLSLTGFAKNLSDGRVEVVACGDENQIQLLETWLHQGPPSAEVTDVIAEVIPFEAHSNFITK